MALQNMEMTQSLNICNISVVFSSCCCDQMLDMMQFQDARMYSDLPFKGIGQESMVAEAEASGSHCVFSQEAKPTEQKQMGSGSRTHTLQANPCYCFLQEDITS